MKDEFLLVGEGGIEHCCRRAIWAKPASVKREWSEVDERYDWGEAWNDRNVAIMIKTLN